MERKRVGHIVNTFGINGGLKVVITTSYPEERFKEGNKIIINDNGHEKTFVVDYYKVKNDKVIHLFLKGIDDINQVEKYINYDIYMDCERIEGTFYFDDLKDMDICSENLEVIDKVVSTREDLGVCHIMTSQNKDIPVQMGIFIKNIDLENKRVILTALGEETLNV